MTTPNPEPDLINCPGHPCPACRVGRDCTIRVSHLSLPPTPTMDQPQAAD